VHKARFCLGGHRDFLKHRIVHTASTLSQNSTRLILSLAAILGWDVWTTDVQQAYLQSAQKLQKEIFLKTDALELGPNEFLKLVLPLYGLSEAGDYWGETLANHHLLGLRFEQSPIDFSSFVKRIGKRLVGISGTYVDDMLSAAEPEMKQFLEDSIRDEFDCKPSQNVDSPVTFVGLDLERCSDGFQASMRSYIDRLQPILLSADFDVYRRLRAQLLWVANARPDICAFISFCSSVTACTFTTKDIAAINERVRVLTETNADVSLKFPALDVETLHLLVYTDASFGSRVDGSIKQDMSVFSLTNRRDAVSSASILQKPNELRVPPWRRRRLRFLLDLIMRLLCDMRSVS
jgi:Reverse transcriptase (RNA-dependent DNA polymerase)